MRRLGLGLFLIGCLLFLFVSSAVAHDPDPWKWQQLPNMDDPLATDWSSTIPLGTIVADDWMCEHPHPATDIHWWGSLPYEPDDPTDPLYQPIAFQITIYAYNEDPGYSQPGAILLQEYHDYYQWWGYGPDAGGDWVYDYCIFLDEPFEQIPGELYFLSIEADYPAEDVYNWGWHEAITHNFDDAVYWFDGTWIPIEAERGDPLEWQSLDMAFEVSIPEPATMALFGLGLLGLGARLRRRKQS